MDWPAVVVGYLTYLVAVSLVRPAGRRARAPLLVAAPVVWAVLLTIGMPAQVSPWAAVVVPAGFLLAGYWVSGLFFETPDVRLERWLLAVDRRLLGTRDAPRGLRRAPAAIAEALELCYLLVYAVMPAGALTLAAGGHPEAVGRYWTVVLLAEFACYAMLPWIQTRPPRVLEGGAAELRPALLRRINLRVTGTASIQANTIPSGHAAGAVAAALAVMSTLPLAGAVFLVLAAAITLATVAGRYHYVVDAVLGVAVGAGAWIAVG